MSPDLVPKLCGADVELGNFLLGGGAGARASSPIAAGEGSGFAASQALLREFDGVSAGRAGGLLPGCDCPTCRARRAARESGPLAGAPSSPSSLSLNAFDAQDFGRKFLPQNGGCVYIDLDHLELCLPEVRGAHEHVAAWHAMLRLAQQAQRAANSRLPRGSRVAVLVNNSDGLGNSYGAHLNFLVSRRAWDALFQRKLHHLAYLTAFQVSSVAVSGQGKVGSENGAPPARFQLSQRADFMETLTGPQTTFRRPLVNSRDEPLCGGDRARLHVIFYDSNLCPSAGLLKVGTLQLVLAMLEAGQVDPGLALEDPLEALQRFSRDPLLRARAALASGGEVTAVELQERFCAAARRFVDTGAWEGIVPRAPEIVELWERTLADLARRDLAALAGRLDWVLKLALLERLLRARPDLDWGSPEVKHLDQLYSSLDPEEGLYWQFARGGRIASVGEEELASRFTAEPPADTRAWGRAMLLRLATPAEVAEVDWDHLRFRLDGGRGWPRWRQVALADPLRGTRAELGAALEGAPTLTAALDSLDQLEGMGEPAEEETEPRSPVASGEGGGYEVS